MALSELTALLCMGPQDRSEGRFAVLLQLCCCNMCRRLMSCSGSFVLWAHQMKLLGLGSHNSLISRTPSPNGSVSPCGSVFANYVCHIVMSV